MDDGNTGIVGVVWHLDSVVCPRYVSVDRRNRTFT